MGQKRIEYLDALRAFAILGVIITHAAIKTDVGGKLRELTNLGGYGVQLFFVVSAFTILMTIRSGRKNQSRPTLNFFIKRLMRIVPIYWGGVIIYTSIYGVYAPHGWGHTPENQVDYLANIFLINILIPGAENSVVPGGWSISVETLFYICAPLLTLYATSLRRSLILTVLLFAVGKALAIVLMSLPGAENLEPIYWVRSPLLQFPCFGLGMVLFYAVQIPIGAKPALTSALLMGASLVAFVLAREFYTISDTFFAVSFVIFAYALHLMPWKLLVNRLTVALGRMSYSTYILHFVVLDMLHKLIIPDGISSTKQFAILLVTGAPLSVLLASFSYHYIENTTSRIAKKLVARVEARASNNLPNSIPNAGPRVPPA